MFQGKAYSSYRVILDKINTELKTRVFQDNRGYFSRTILTGSIKTDLF